MRKRAGHVLAVLLVVGAACSADESADQAADAQSQRARDSVIGESSLPGAQGVQGAMRAADSSAARQGRLDSLGQTP